MRTVNPGSGAWRGQAASWAADPLVHGSAGAVLLLVAILVVGAGSYRAFVVQLVVVYVIAALGLNVPAGFGGALSLGQGAAFGIGAYTVAIAVDRLGAPVWFTLPGALAIGLMLGLVIGLPASRLGTIGLAMISLGLTIVAADVALQARSITGGHTGLMGIRPSWWFDGEHGLSAVALAVMVVGLGLVTYVWHWRFRSSSLGRATIASRDNAIGAKALGIDVGGVQARAFALGTAVGALAGGLYVYLIGVVTPGTADAWLSIALLAMVILGGSGSRVGPVAGAVVLSVIPIYLSRYHLLSEFLYGALLIIAIRFMPRGLVPAGPAVVTPRRGSPTTTPVPSPGADVAADEVVVSARDVAKRFDGIYALQEVSLDLRRGEVLGIVGPNGSGKTTLLNVITGHYPPSAGQVEVLGRVIGSSPREVALAGVGRTFQTPRVFPSMSVAEHIALARDHACTAGPPSGTDGHGPPPALPRIGGLFDVSANGAQPASALSHGQLRFLELAMAIVRRPAVLLLDEPAAGLSAAEIEEFERIVAQVSREGTAVVLVEHHLDLVRRVADRVAVLHLGRVLWVGPPEALDTVVEVQDAYLGGTSEPGGTSGPTTSQTPQETTP